MAKKHFIPDYLLPSWFDYLDIIRNHLKMPNAVTISHAHKLNRQYADAIWVLKDKKIFKEH
jgi:energy-coupling factor transporter ATP-binding protein EcfA2